MPALTLLILTGTLRHLYGDKNSPLFDSLCGLAYCYSHITSVAAYMQRKWEHKHAVWHVNTGPTAEDRQTSNE